MSHLSVVIPVLDEGRRIEATLARLADVLHAGGEIIVVDGGSSDDTLSRAARAGVTCVHAPRGRAIQMNAGARHARGRLLAFLHADTLPSDAVIARLVEIAAAPRSPCWGRFDVRIDDTAFVFRLIESAMNLRSRLTQVATGDQLMFVDRGLFQAVGGFPSIALMEDVALSKILRRWVRARCCRETVLTSARRWRRRGPLRTMALMWWLRLRFAMGADPDRLAVAYRAAETDP